MHQILVGDKHSVSINLVQLVFNSEVPGAKCCVFESVGELFGAAVQAIAWEGRLLPIGTASGKVPEINILKPLANFSIVGTDFASYTVRAIDVVRRSLTEILD